jgi:ubiquinone/menaquinone biosynthesis C-methylase UbiE
MAEFFQPEQIITRLEIKSGMKIADFGAGSGYFSIPFSKIVGSSGRVTALEIQKDVLDVLRVRAKNEGLLNIDVIWANIELPRGSKLEDNSQDLVLASNVLFQAEDKNAVMAEAMRILKPGGMFCVIEWVETDPPPGPPRALRIPKQILKDQCERAGFSLYRDLSAESHHYGFLFKK